MSQALISASLAATNGSATVAVFQHDCFKASIASTLAREDSAALRLADSHRLVGVLVVLQDHFRCSRPPAILDSKPARWRMGYQQLL